MEELDPPSKFRLYSAVICVNVPSFIMGTCITWTSPMMPKLREQTEDSPLDFKINSQQEGLIYSLLSIGAVFSVYFAGRLANRFGRKSVLVLASCVYVVAYIQILFAPSIGILYLARLCHGIGAGTSMAVVPMYSIELSTRESRGSVGTIMMLFMTLGQLFALVLGPYTEYWVFQLLCLSIPLISFGGYIYIPESPHWLVKQDRIEDAVHALRRVRGQTIGSVMKEIPYLVEVVDRANEIRVTVSNDIINHAGNRKALIIAVGLMTFQILSGAIVLVINSQSIFDDAGSALDPPVCAIIVGIVQVLAGVYCQIIVNNLKRRTLLKISAFIMGLCQFSMGMIFYIHEQFGASNVPWLPLVSLIVFQIAYRSGFGPLPLTIAGELSAANIKPIVVSAATMTCWGLGFFVALFYPMVNELGEYYIFFFFSICCTAAFIFVELYVIETKGLSLKEISELLEK